MAALDRFVALRPAAGPAPAGRRVLVASDTLLGETVVLKVAPADAPAAADLHAEAALLAELAHPALVRLHAVLPPTASIRGLDGPHTGFATRWVEGVPLDEGLGPASDPAAALHRFAALLGPVEYLHRRGLLHLDLKPANALVGPDGAVTLLDLGTARPMDAGPGEAGGTLGYAAPEVLDGEAAGPTADLWSLGAVLYRMLSGAGPHVPTEGPALRRAVLGGAVVPISARRPGLPAGLVRLLDALLQSDPLRRPPSVAAVAEALAALGVAVPPRDGAPPFRARRADWEALCAEAAAGGAWWFDAPGGAGGARCARRLLSATLGASSWVDFSRCGAVRVALDAFFGLAGLSLPGAAGGPEWCAALAAAPLARAGLPAPGVFLGAWEGRSAADRAAMEAAARAIGDGGGLAIGLRPGGRRTLPRLGLDDALAIGAFFGGVDRSTAEAVLARTGGMPGAVVAALDGRAEAGDPLAGLPPDPAPAVLERLSPGARAVVRARLARGAAVGGPPGVAPVPGVVAWVDGLDVRLDPLWVTVARARCGLPARTPVLPPDRPEPRRALLLECAHARVAAGDDAWRTPLALQLEADGQLPAAAAALQPCAGRDAETDLRLARLLRRAGQPGAAASVVEAALARAPSVALQLERAHVALALGDLLAAEQACTGAEALDPATADAEALALRVALAAARVKAGDPVPGLAALVQRVAGLRTAAAVPSTTWSAAGRLAPAAGHPALAVPLLERAIVAADAERDERRAAGHRLNLANLQAEQGHGRDARRSYQDALDRARRIPDADITQRVLYGLADLELRAGRTSPAEAAVEAFATALGGAPPAEAELRLRELRARVALARERPAEARDLLDPVDLAAVPPAQRPAWDAARAAAALGCGDPAGALRAVADTPPPRGPIAAALLDAQRGRAHLALGRAALRRARALLPGLPELTRMAESPSAPGRAELGEVLAAAVGEDLDPDDFADRRAALAVAARLVQGPARGRLATLHDRLLDGPGAGLDGIVRLTEAIHAPERFPAEVARLVREALGAHRVLILLSIPGIGRQTGVQELSLDEAAGISGEVIRRIRKPGDTWIADDAFADPALRESSQTVRTFQLKSLVAVAIPQGERCVGALYADDQVRSHRFGASEIGLLQRLAGAIGRMLPLLARAPVQRPRRVFGVHLEDPAQVQELEDLRVLLGGPGPHTLLISGPTGAGKSILAQRVAQELFGAKGVEHVVLRRGEPQFLVTQLAGSRVGDFTGAINRPGAIQRALDKNLVLFLDELQNLDDPLQQILLPLLESPVRRFGGLSEAAAPLRGTLHVILGTNAEVRGGAWAQVFREDLWYRISGVHVDLPPLAERGNAVVHATLCDMLAELDAPPPERLFDPEVLRLVVEAPWPGNLRELNRFAGNAARWAAEAPLGRAHLRRLLPALPGAESPAAAPADAPLGDALREHVRSTLSKHRWVQKDAAAALGLSPSALNKLLKRHGLLDEVRRRRVSVSDDAGGASG